MAFILFEADGFVVSVRLGEEALYHLKRVRGYPVVLDLRDSHCNYPIEKLTIREVEPEKLVYVKRMPKNVVPVHILSVDGRPVAFGFLKRQKSGPVPEDAKRVFPSIVAMKPEEAVRDHKIRVATGYTLQIGVPIPATDKKTILERFLEKAEEAAAHGLKLIDFNPKNFARGWYGNFDNTLAPIPDNEDVREVLRDTVETFAFFNGIEVPEKVWRRIDDYNPQQARRRLEEKRRRVWALLRRGYVG